MCIGVPVVLIQVQAPEAVGAAVAPLPDETRAVDLSLVGPQPVGAYVLTHLGRALRVLDAEEATQIARALLAVARAASGESVGDLFADLDREPQLPPHLRPATEPRLDPSGPGLATASGDDATHPNPPSHAPRAGEGPEAR
jgi:hydrogenase expression/formation protein HypC